MSAESRVGRELDAEVARAIGWKVEGATEFGAWVAQRPDGSWVRLADCRFSTDIAAAWPLAERYGLVVGPAIGGGFYAAKFDDFDGHMGEDFEYLDACPKHIAYGRTAPLAICLAVLSAIEARTEGGEG